MVFGQIKFHHSNFLIKINLHFKNSFHFKYYFIHKNFMYSVMELLSFHYCLILTEKHHRFLWNFQIIDQILVDHPMLKCQLQYLKFYFIYFPFVKFIKLVVLSLFIILNLGFIANTRFVVNFNLKDYNLYCNYCFVSLQNLFNYLGMDLHLHY